LACPLTIAPIEDHTLVDDDRIAKTVGLDRSDELLEVIAFD
jgi:hypothetical protein